MFFNICLSVFLALNFLLTFAGLGAVIKKVDAITEMFKKQAEVETNRIDIDRSISMALGTLTNALEQACHAINDIDHRISLLEVKVNEPKPKKTKKTKEVKEVKEPASREDLENL